MVKFSIITVSYNSAKTIEATIKSVIAQKYCDYEYIIVDGGSGDGTIKIIKQYSKFIDKFVSEKDKGIYDAMNKGVKFAKGKYILFLNSDDIFVSENVLLEVVKYSTGKEDLIYGDVQFFYPKDKTTSRISRPASLSNLKKGIMPPHQGSFVKREILIKNPFDIKYKSSADFDFFCRAFGNKFIVKKVPVLVAQNQVGGISSSGISYKESREIVRKYFGYFAYVSLYLKQIMFSVARFLIDKFGLGKFLRKQIN